MQSSLQNQGQMNASQVTAPGTTSSYQIDPKAPLKKYKILIVEDENDAREVFVQLLQTNLAYEVSSAADGQDALARIEAEGGKFDLILLDIVMPRLDGVDTLRKIRAEKEKYGDPIVVMLTNLGGEVAIDTAMKLGAQGYLMKIEVEPVQLLEKIEEFLKKKEETPAAPVTEAKPVEDASKKIIQFNPGQVNPIVPETKPETPVEPTALPKAA
ncbi:MAG: response regulator [Candidatus Dojkabacteria bacterium]